MPYRDKETRNARQRERYARLKAEDPEFVAKKKAKEAEWYQRKAKEDEAWREKRKSDYDKWYAAYGKENARSRKGYVPKEEYLAQCEKNRRSRNDYMKEWGKTEAGQRSRAAQSVKKRCGMSIEEYDSAYDDQDGNCRICGTHRERYGKDRLVVDHCHVSGKFRALLCGACNSAIGLLGESEERLLGAIKYLREITSA